MIDTRPMAPNAPLKTLRVTPYFEPAFCYGGPAVSVPNACRALVREGTRVTVFTTTAAGDEELAVVPGAEHDLDGVKVRYFARRPPRTYFRSPALFAAIQQRVTDFDLMHLHGVFCYTNWAAYRAARRADIPYVVTVHGCLDPAVLQQRVQPHGYPLQQQKHIAHGHGSFDDKPVGNASGVG